MDQNTTYNMFPKEDDISTVALFHKLFPGVKYDKNSPEYRRMITKIRKLKNRGFIIRTRTVNYINYYKRCKLCKGYEKMRKTSG